MDDNTKTRAWFGAAFAVLLGVGIAAIVRTYEWEASVAWVSHSYELSARLDQLTAASKNADSAVRQVALNYDPSNALRLSVDLQRIQALFAEVGRLARDEAIQTANLQAAHPWLLRQNDLIHPDSAPGANPAQRLRAAIAAYDRLGAPGQIARAMATMQAEEQRLLNIRMERQREVATTTRRLFELASLLSFALVLLAASRAGRTHKPDSAEQQRLREAGYRQIVEMAGDIIYRTDSSGRFTFCNQAALNTMHWTDREVIGRSFLTLIPQNKRKEVEHFYLRQYARKRKNSYFEFPVLDGHGRERWIGQNAQLIMGADGFQGFQAIAREITERRKAEGDLNRSRAFIERIAATTPGILYVYDLSTRRNVYSNREVVTVLGYKPEDLDKYIAAASRQFHPDDIAGIRAHNEGLRHACDGEVRRIEYRARHRDGHWVWLAARDTPFERGPDGLVRQIVGIAQDVTARRAAQEKLTWQANYDALTGLANRHHFWNLLQGLMRHTAIQSGRAALCLLDLDNFKEANDRFGHSAGDEVLESVGAILRSELRASDIAGRLGGDEFCFCLPETDGNEAARMAERILDRLRTQAFGMASHGATFSITATFGIAEWRADMDARELMEA
ncbi:MAG TPA: diguanylate cyclase, partial [Bryobacteraceae bacterium]|nr:diguanylate cyclase [Bryobacteraceae bacterium]